MPARTATSVDLIHRQRKHRIADAPVRRLAMRVMRELGREGWEVAVTFVSAPAMRALNRRYRTKDRPTDVLAFPDPMDGLTGDDSGDARVPTGSGRHLGDVIISPQVAYEQALESGTSFEREVKYLVVHGLLHLCGYDHETDRGQMRRLERRLRRRFIPEPA
ncbi:MAG: rRNA maturation RNase YbeY [Acidobacteria bacterium]|nr:rRNA maturation RNase YbeY [Acidobacteriota bacterium]